MPKLKTLSRCLVVVLCASALLAPVTPRAEDNLRLTGELQTKANDALGTTTLRLAPDPVLEVQDQLPPIPTIDLTAQPDDLWQRLRNGFSMPDLDSPLVADRQAWYLNRPDLLRRVVERSRRYLFHIVGELEKRGMPTELALLPIVESSFNPLAYSRAKALGMWQFIPATGKSYNLQQNWWLDQRRDIVASTSAALDYLQNIYEMHGDWHLALASYNWGENAVARAVAKNKARGLHTDYQHLTMPGETRYYVPKLQAIKNIIAQPQLFGFRLEPIPNKPYFGTVDINEAVDIATAAKLAETPLDEFIALNPAYHRPVIPGESKSLLVIPAEKMDTFLANVARYEAQDKPLSAWLTHRLLKGEKLDAVASRYGISGSRLRQLNGITARTKVLPGLTLLVPGKDALRSDDVSARLPHQPAEPSRAAKGGKGGKTVKGKARPAAKGHAKAAAKPAKKPAAKNTVKSKPVKRR